MVDLLQPTAALAKLQSARTHLQNYIDYLTLAFDQAKSCADPAGNVEVAQASQLLYKADLQDALNLLDDYLVLVDPATGTVQQKKTALTQLGITLQPTPGTAVGTDAGWDRGSSERVSEAYRAVYNIIKKISDEVFCGDRLLGSLQFKRTFGGTSLQLAIEKINQTTPYAETQNPGGGTIFLYLEPDTPRTQEDITRGWIVHTAENIIHEFGHVLVFRNGSDNSEIYQEWAGIRIFVEPFGPELGWSQTNYDKLQNDMVNLSGSELENERTANMFEAFVTGYKPDIDNAVNATQRRAAWAMWTFMSGIHPPDDVNIDLTGQNDPSGQGIMYWIQFYGSTQ